MNQISFKLELLLLLLVYIIIPINAFQAGYTYWTNSNETFTSSDSKYNLNTNVMNDEVHHLYLQKQYMNLNLEYNVTLTSYGTNSGIVSFYFGGDLPAQNDGPSPNGITLTFDYSSGLKYFKALEKNYTLLATADDFNNKSINVYVSISTLGGIGIIIDGGFSYVINEDINPNYFINRNYNVFYGIYVNTRSRLQIQIEDSIYKTTNPVTNVLNDNIIMKSFQKTSLFDYNNLNLLQVNDIFDQPYSAQTNPVITKLIKYEDYLFSSKIGSDDIEDFYSNEYILTGESFSLTLKGSIYYEPGVDSDYSITILLPESADSPYIELGMPGNLIYGSGRIFYSEIDVENFDIRLEYDDENKIMHIFNQGIQIVATTFNIIDSETFQLHIMVKHASVFFSPKFIYLDSPKYSVINGDPSKLSLNYNDDGITFKVENNETSRFSFIHYTRILETGLITIEFDKFTFPNNSSSIYLFFGSKYLPLNRNVNFGGLGLSMYLQGNNGVLEFIKRDGGKAKYVLTSAYAKIYYQMVNNVQSISVGSLNTPYFSETMENAEGYFGFIYDTSTNGNIEIPVMNIDNKVPSVSYVPYDLYIPEQPSIPLIESGLTPISTNNSLLVYQESSTAVNETFLRELYVPALKTIQSVYFNQTYSYNPYNINGNFLLNLTFFNYKPIRFAFKVFSAEFQTLYADMTIDISTDCKYSGTGGNGSCTLINPTINQMNTLTVTRYDTSKLLFTINGITLNLSNSYTYAENGVYFSIEMESESAFKLKDAIIQINYPSYIEYSTKIDTEYIATKTISGDRSIVEITTTLIASSTSTTTVSNVITLDSTTYNVHTSHTKIDEVTWTSIHETATSTMIEFTVEETSVTNLLSETTKFIYDTTSTVINPTTETAASLTEITTTLIASSTSTTTVSNVITLDKKTYNVHTSHTKIDEITWINLLETATFTVIESNIIEETMIFTTIYPSTNPTTDHNHSTSLTTTKPSIIETTGSPTTTDTSTKQSETSVTLTHSTDAEENVASGGFPMGAIIGLSVGAGLVVIGAAASAVYYMRPDAIIEGEQEGPSKNLDFASVNPIYDRYDNIKMNSIYEGTVPDDIVLIDRL